MCDYLYKVNPLKKCLIVLVAAVALSFTDSTALNLSVFSLTLLLIATGSRKIKSAIKFLVPTALVAGGFLLTGLYFGGDSQHTGVISVASWRVGINLSTRIFAFAGLGMVFSLTTNSLEFVRALYLQAGLPRKFAYGLLCAFHLLPYLKQEYEDARLAVAIRGVKVTPFSLKPIFSTLANSIRWSEALSIAMQSKGFED